MLRTIVVPDRGTITIPIPDEYVGKPVEVQITPQTEISSPGPEKKSPADLRGSLKLTDEQRRDLGQYLIDVRKEWEREF